MAKLSDADKLLADVRKNSGSCFAEDLSRKWVGRQQAVDAAPVEYDRNYQKGAAGCAPRSIMRKFTDTKNSIAFQRRLYWIMVDYLRDHNYPPSVRELCDLSGIRSTSTIHAYMEKMHDNGYIEKTGPGGIGHSRAYRIRGVKMIMDEEDPVF